MHPRPPPASPPCHSERSEESLVTLLAPPAPRRTGQVPLSCLCTRFFARPFGLPLNDRACALFSALSPAYCSALVPANNLARFSHLPFQGLRPLFYSLFFYALIRFRPPFALPLCHSERSEESLDNLLAPPCLHNRPHDKVPSPPHPGHPLSTCLPSLREVAGAACRRE